MKHAFTMLELIFAIVIIGVSMLALPTIMFQDSNSQERSLFQEGIMLTTQKASQIMTYPWDPNSSPGGALITANEVLDTGGHADLNRIAGTDFRLGHFQQTLRRRMTPNSNPRAASAIGAGVNSISSYNGVIDNVTVTDPNLGYKKQWQLAIAVNYVSDNATYTDTNISNLDFRIAPLAGVTSSIKMITVTATDNTPGTVGDQVVLRSYSTNIGEAEFYKRRY